MSDISAIAPTELLLLTGPIYEEPANDELLLCKCGKDSLYGVHGFDGYDIYSRYYCQACYNESKGARSRNE